MKDIEVREISKAYDGRPVLEKVSLRFPAGTTTCITGPSGCGKTTLLRIIAGLETADSGSVTGVPEGIGFVFQEDRLCGEFSAVSNVRIAAGKKPDREEIIRHLTALGLGNDLNKPVKEFSGGMKRRVAIARAVCCPSELLILDEPFKGLDEKLHLEVIEYIKTNSRGRTVICVTHEPEDAEKMNGSIMKLI